MFNLKNPAVDIGFVCSDFDESLRFYRDVLEMEVVQELQIPHQVAVTAGLAPREFRQVRLKAGTSLIKLMEIENPPPSRTYDFQAGIRWLTFIVDDVPACIDRLAAKGAEFMSEVVSPLDAKHIICVKGPDGVLIELVQPFND